MAPAKQACLGSQDASKTWLDRSQTCESQKSVSTIGADRDDRLAPSSLKVGEKLSSWFGKTGERAGNPKLQNAAAVVQCAVKTTVLVRTQIRLD
jgi:hypothetical protein